MSAIDKAIDVLFALAREGQDLGISELGRQCEIDKASTFRALKALESRGFVEQDPATKKYRLGLAIVKLAGAKLRQMPLSSVAQPHLTRLSQETGETVQLSVIDRGHVLYLAVVEGAQPIRVAAGVGAHGPLHCTAAGKVLLAFGSSQTLQTVLAAPLKRYTQKTVTDVALLQAELEEIRKRGWSVDNEGFVDHLRVAAAPIRNLHGQVVAAIAVGGPSTRVTSHQLTELGAAVVRAGSNISSELAHGED